MKPTAIIDCDPGHDDVMALLLGGRHLDLVGITTVFGNASLDKTTQNARKTVEFAELTSVPIARGASRPLVREVRHAPEVHGETGLDGPELPQPEIPLNEQHAVDFILDKSRAVEGLCLAPVGPLTNVAMAIQRDPTLSGRVRQISLMGGSVGSGNSTPAAEFNIWCDPEAAHVVFTSGIPIKMVGLNATREVPATAERRAQIRSLGNRTGGIVADLLDYYSERSRILFGRPGGPMHDPLAVAALIDPEILTFEPMHVAVELRGEHTYGMTVCDTRDIQDEGLPPEARGVGRGQSPNAEVAVAANADRFWELFLDTLRTYP